jgi:hypothetical protein
LLSDLFDESNSTTTTGYTFSVYDAIYASRPDADVLSDQLMRSASQDSGAGFTVYEIAAEDDEDEEEPTTCKSSCREEIMSVV